MTDLLLLGFATYATLGYMQKQNNIFHILSLAGNQGSIDQATDKKDSGGIGNFSPNLQGSGPWQAMSSDMPPLPAFKRGPLDPVTPNHPGMSTPLIRNLAVPSIGY